MSNDETINPPADGAAQSPPADQAANTPPAEDSTDWKSEARKWEARAKENRDAAAKLQALEDAQKTEAQKQAEALTEAQKLAAESTAKALRYEVAASKDLPLPLALRLTGSTQEELEADADTLKALLAAQAPKSSLNADPSQGRGSEPAPSNLTEAVKAHYA